MKKILLFISVLFFVHFTINAQKATFVKKEIRGLKANFNQKIGIEPIQETPLVAAQPVTQQVNKSGRDMDIVTIIDIGTSANKYSYGYMGGQKQILCYDPDLNVLTHFHRMGGALDPDGYSGDLGYDISLDGGMTWENEIECYVATENGGGTYYTDAARYPNHGFWNSDGTIEGAYVVFFCPNLDQSNGSSWGGYSYGIINIADTSIRTKNLQSSDPDNDIYQYIPDGYTLTGAGLSLAVDINQDWTSGSLVYMDQIILNKGYYDEDEEDFVYEQDFLDFPIVHVDEQYRPSFVQTAFSADGMTGYIVTLADDGSNEQIGESYRLYPIYWKTTNGGEDWEGPTSIQLDGPNGLGAVVYHLLNDSIYNEFYGDTPREEVGYTTAFDMDCTVDLYGDLHIAVVVGAAASSNYSIASNEGLFGVMDIYTTNGGDTWFGEIMGYPQCFRGYYPDDTYYEDNRVQITTNEARDKMFISWLDTFDEDDYDNNRPNIFVRGFDPVTLMKTVNKDGEDAPYNVTFLSPAMNQAHFALAANFCIDTDGTYTIPYTFQQLDQNDPDSGPVQYKYIQDFSFTDEDFLIQGINEETASNQNFEVSQNYPNPVNDQTYFSVTLNQGADVSVRISSITGQIIHVTDYGHKTTGTHTLKIDASNLAPGVYFYTVTSGNQKVTHKMIVQ